MNELDVVLTIYWCLGWAFVAVWARNEDYVPDSAKVLYAKLCAAVAKRKKAKA